jgi:hypothetical protein
MRLKHLAIISIYAIGLGILLLFSFVPEVRAFDEADLLTIPIRATVIKGKTLDEVLDTLTSDYGIPVGIELGDEKLTPSRKIDLNLPETNLKNFLDAAIAKDPRYTWKLDAGVIHVWPIRGRDQLVATILNSNISHFAITGEVSRYGIYHDIMNLPEIRSQLVIAGVEPLILFVSGRMVKLRKDTRFAESNLTLRELLDKIVLKTEIKRWVITRWGENSEFITLRS